MLDSGKKRSHGESKVITIIGQGTTITGDIKSKGTIRVEGMVHGRIHCDDSIVIQETGKVKAELMAAQIVISGEVEGNVFANDRLEITSNGRLVGDITAPKVSIAEGVMFEGKCAMKPPGQVKPPQQQGGPQSSASQDGIGEKAPAENRSKEEEASSEPQRNAPKPQK